MSESLPFLIPIKKELLAVEKLMLDQAHDHDRNLQSALSHLLKSGGKRIRPALCILTGKILNAPKEQLIPLASAIELLHTASLVHDDLIDGALLRRGIPTLNSEWSVSATVLTGDFLFACAAKLAAETNSISVMKCFAKTVTILANGEVTQMFSEPCRADKQKYIERIYAKTASLFETCTLASALLSPTDIDKQERMREFGYSLGMAFQIVDDILDFTADQTAIGKPIGSDLRQGLITMPTLQYFAHYPNDVNSIKLINGNCINDLNGIDKLITAIKNSNAIELSYNESNQFINHAINLLDIFPVCEEKKLLTELAEYLYKRDR